MSCWCGVWTSCGVSGRTRMSASGVDRRHHMRNSNYNSNQLLLISNNTLNNYNYALFVHATDNLFNKFNVVWVDLCQSTKFRRIPVREGSRNSAAVALKSKLWQFLQCFGAHLFYSAVIARGYMSVRPSHSSVLSRRMNVWSCSLQLQVGQSWKDKDYPDICRGSPPARVLKWGTSLSLAKIWQIIGRNLEMVQDRM